MTYQNRKEGWIGFCDECNMPYKPEILNYCKFLVDNKNKKHFKIKFKDQEVVGYCKGCCGKEGSSGSNLFYNIEHTPELEVRIVRGVKVV